ncbi:hypothetical protein SDC9_113097 [bioreactor metagenome]|uniref:Uncharacterized protein n=1 Tax=bioreactor metagenome TaxID=1076179 RepID=A0A645BL46_9ZZZZ
MSFDDLNRNLTVMFIVRFLLILSKKHVIVMIKQLEVKQMSCLEYKCLR